MIMNHLAETQLTTPILSHLGLTRSYEYIFARVKTKQRNAALNLQTRQNMWMCLNRM